MALVIIESDFIESLIRKNERLVCENEKLRMIARVLNDPDKEADRDYGYME